MAPWGTAFGQSVNHDKHAGYLIVKEYCQKCHGKELVVPGLDVLDRGSLTEEGYLTEGDLDGSEIWQRLAVSQDMPPEGERQLSDQQITTVEKWILDGAPYPELTAARRGFTSQTQLLSGVLEHLRATPREDRPFQRYFSLVNISNNSSEVSDEVFRLYQAAVSKTVNSLSWASRIVAPRVIDSSGVVLVIDLRDYGWERNAAWRKLFEQYPYGLTHEDSADPVLSELAREVYRLSRTEMPVLRADWFVSTATRPELYYQILKLPESAASLEHMLRVDVARDYQLDRLDRSGMVASGVSTQNRIVDRHESAYGAYWKSYDFGPGKGERADILRRPLGPAALERQYDALAFEHDGGEIIFSLPNGLHAYYLTDGKDQRINEGPISVVSDALKTSGSPAIANGLSCIACHRHGTIPLKDVLRTGAGVFGVAKRKLDRIVPTQDAMDGLLQDDSSGYLQSLRSAMAPFVVTAGTATGDIRDFPEPISLVARRYQRDLSIAAVASELGVQDQEQLAQQISSLSQLRSLGLGPLAENGQIKRTSWESAGSRRTVFHRTASALDLGDPFTSLSLGF